MCDGGRGGSGGRGGGVAVNGSDSGKASPSRAAHPPIAQSKQRVHHVLETDGTCTDPTLGLRCHAVLHGVSEAADAAQVDQKELGPLYG